MSFGENVMENQKVLENVTVNWEICFWLVLNKNGQESKLCLILDSRIFLQI
jgi:hypothetical protein